MRNVNDRLRANLIFDDKNVRRDTKSSHERIARHSKRFWNRPSRRLYLRPENMESLSLDLLGNVVRLPRLQLQLYPRNSDSSNNASVEASSESMIHRREFRFGIFPIFQAMLGARVKSLLCPLRTLKSNSAD